MNAINDFLKNTNWAMLNGAIEASNLGTQKWFESFKDAVVADGVLTYDELAALKDFYAVATFTFHIPIKARDKSHAVDVFDQIPFDPSGVLDDGTRIDGTYDNSHIYSGTT